MSGDIIATQEHWAYSLDKLIVDSHIRHEIYMRSSWSCMSSSVQLSEVELCSVLLKRSRWCSRPASNSPPSPPPLKWICGASRDKKKWPNEWEETGMGRAGGGTGRLSFNRVHWQRWPKTADVWVWKRIWVFGKVCLESKVLDFVRGCICSADYHSKSRS